jgi:hypothetical protein
MKKRSAMTIAGGLVAALLTGAVALSLGFSNGGAATTTAAPAQREPRVRTIERTIKVHRKSKHTPAPIVRTIPAPAAPAAPAPAAPSAPDRPARHDRPSSDSPSGDMSEGDDNGTDDEFGEDDEQSEDHESDDDGGEDDGGFDD